MIKLCTCSRVPFRWLASVPYSSIARSTHLHRSESECTCENSNRSISLYTYFPDRDQVLTVRYPDGDCTSSHQYLAQNSSNALMYYISFDFIRVHLLCFYSFILSTKQNITSVKQMQRYGLAMS